MKRTIHLRLSELHLNVIRESLDHHVKALVWRKNNDVGTNMDRVERDIADTNEVSDAIESQMRNR